MMDNARRSEYWTAGGSLLAYCYCYHPHHCGCPPRLDCKEALGRRSCFGSALLSAAVRCARRRPLVTNSPPAAPRPPRHPAVVHRRAASFLLLATLCFITSCCWLQHTRPAQLPQASSPIPRCGPPPRRRERPRCTPAADTSSAEASAAGRQSGTERRQPQCPRRQWSGPRRRECPYPALSVEAPSVASLASSGGRPPEYVQQIAYIYPMARADKQQPHARVTQTVAGDARRF